MLLSKESPTRLRKKFSSAGKDSGSQTSFRLSSKSLADFSCYCSAKFLCVSWAFYGLAKLTLLPSEFLARSRTAAIETERKKETGSLSALQPLVALLQGSSARQTKRRNCVRSTQSTLE